GIGTGTLGSGVGTLGVGSLGGVVGAVSTRAACARIAGVRAVGRPLVGGRPVGGRTAGIGAVSGLLVLHVELIDDHAAVARSLGGRVLLAGLGVRTATVAQVHDATVGRGPLVGAGPDPTERPDPRPPRRWPRTRARGARRSPCRAADRRHRCPRASVAPTRAPSRGPGARHRRAAARSRPRWRTSRAGPVPAPPPTTSRGSRAWCTRRHA